MIEVIEFVKKFGWVLAKDLANRDKTSVGYLSVEHYGLNQDDLKRLVESWELVEKFGGLFHEKVTLEKEGFTGGIELDGELIEDVVLKQAIELVEIIGE